jgi:ATP phosphoribosyltransferase
MKLTKINESSKENDDRSFNLNLSFGGCRLLYFATSKIRESTVRKTFGKNQKIAAL